MSHCFCAVQAKSTLQSDKRRLGGCMLSNIAAVLAHHLTRIVSKLVRVSNIDTRVHTLARTLCAYRQHHLISLVMWQPCHANQSLCYCPDTGLQEEDSMHPIIIIIIIIRTSASPKQPDRVTTKHVLNTSM